MNEVQKLNLLLNVNVKCVLEDESEGGKWDAGEGNTETQKRETLTQK